MGVKGQSWNGSGMAFLTKERRQEINAKMNEKVMAQREGWPKPVACFATDPLYHEKTDAEFQTRLEMAAWRRK